MLDSIINKSLVIESDSDYGKWGMSGGVSKERGNHQEVF